MTTMFAQTAMDEINGSFFDHIDSLLDFPTEDIDSVFPTMGKSESVLPSIWSAQAESLPGSDSVFSSASSCHLSIPYEDIVQLEWLSTFVEDSFSWGMRSLDMTVATEPKNEWTFQTSSPVSVLDSSSSSSSCSGEKTAVIPGRCGRARSKRPRPASFSPRPAVIQLVSPLPECSVHENDHQGFVPVKIPCESSESFAESYNPVIEILKEAVAIEPTKKKKIKLTLPPKAMTAKVEDEDKDRGTTQAPIRKCLHCHMTKTPQWRAGPLGPKTLCNACGVRYKSGRLFPEYRPAASPTFVLSLHSNSHKKVLEMRSKRGEKPTLGTPRGGIGELIMKDIPELIHKTCVVQMDYM